MLKLTLLIVLTPFVQLEYSKNGIFAGRLVNSPCADENHYVEVPAILSAGSLNSVCLSRVNSGPAYLLLTLATEYGETITVRKELHTDHRGCAEITVPLFPNTIADLTLFVSYPESKCTWEKRISIRIRSGRDTTLTKRASFIPAEIQQTRITDKAFTPTHRPDFSSPCIDRNHLLLAPGVLSAGGSNRACVSRFHTNGTANLLLTLVTEDEETVTVKRELRPGNGGCADIIAPLLPNTKADLITSLTYPESNCTWERRMTVRIGSGRVLTVHTERARYRPGETVRARIFALKADLTPTHGTIEEIWIEGPPGAWEGTRVAQWSRVSSKMGLAQIQHELDELALPGKWTVRARLGDGSQGAAIFSVGNYEIPPFQLTVRTAPRVLRTSERLVWTVCVRYPWTEAVEGMLVIRLRGADSPNVGVRTAVRLRAPRACHRHAAAAWRVGLMGDRPPSVVVADFSFQEEGTRVWQNTTVVSQVVDKPVSLEFISKSRVIVTPSLPYSIKVKATLWDDKPAMNEQVRICRHTTESEIITCNSGTTGFSGIAKVFFTAEDYGSPVYRFEAHLVNDTTIAAEPITIATRQSKVQAALGTLRADNDDGRTYVPLYLSVRNVTSPITVHFVVITRGGLIYRWGATTQCPTLSFMSQVDFNGQCNESLPLTFDINKLDKDGNGIVMTDYMNKIRSEMAGDQNNEILDNLRLYSRERERKNMNTKKFQEYYSRYMSHINKHNESNIDDNKNKIRYTNYNSVSDSFNDNAKFNDKSDKSKLFDNTESIDGSYFDAAHASDALQDSNLLKVLLPIKVTKQMCPDSHLLAYFYHEGEFVSAGKHFEMDDCFVDKVNLTWQSRQVLPGSLTTLEVAVHGPALCALTVTDIAAKLSPVESVKEIIVANLKKMMGTHRSLAEYDNAGDCSLDIDNPEIPSSSLEQAAAWLSRAGVRVIGDMPLRRQCKPAAMMMPEALTVPRSDFSESWLWRLVTVGANGTISTAAKASDSITRFEANAVCLTKTGISVAQPAILQVFREFFIHADSPKRLRRGDNTIIRYRLFNYLYQNLSVQIQILTNPLLQSRSDIVESVCIPPRSSNARRVEIVAVGEGEGMVYLRAKAVKDGGCGKIVTEARKVSDEVVIKITVEPEGIPVHEQKSTLLCGKDSRNIISKRSEVSWSWPERNAVPGTDSLTVWAIGNITGPLLADADSLILLPRGCGEQNMARLATNLLALSHLHPTCAAAATAREHVSRGYTRQLQYIHPSGGFSAFGPSDLVASTWLTAFSVRYLRRAHKMLWPGLPIPQAISRAEGWLLDQQMENGCFRNEGQVFHSEFTGGINEEGETASVALTAYVITSLVEGTSLLPHRVVVNSLSCLRALPPLKRSAPYRVYAQALLAYAFVRLIRYEEEIRAHNEASWVFEQSLKHNEGLQHVMELIKLASTEDDYLWWETSSLSTSIEATSYALLALKESPISLQEYGAGAIRWLASHRSASGGFISTQDTLVALEAMSAWSSFQQTPADLNVTVTADKQGSVFLEAGMTVPEVVKMKGNSVKISVEGAGCALIQATRSYNTLDLDRAGHKTLSVKLQVHTDGPFDCDLENCYCAAVIEACVLWSGVFPEMALLEVTLPGGYEADAKRLYSQLNQTTSSMLHRIEVSASSSRATFYLTSQLPITPRHSCFSVHAVGPRAETMPAHARVFDYYRPSVNDTQVYTIPEHCPPRIAHNTSQDIKDNIYNSARSLSNGEILISSDDMEESPDIVPLDDPLYENLRRNIKNSNTSTKNNNLNTKIDHSINRRLNTNETKREIKKENDHKFNKTKAAIVIDDKLDLSDDQLVIVNKDIQGPEKRIIDDVVNNQSALNIQEKLNVISEPDVNITGNRKDETMGADARENGTESHGSLDVTINNEHKEAYIHKPHSENLEIKDKVAVESQASILIENSNGNQKKVENQNFADFHVIDSEKDLEVPTGVEGPVPSVVLPPPNFVPPTNIDINIDLENPSPQNYAAIFELNRPEEIKQGQNNNWRIVYSRWPEGKKRLQSQYVPPNIFSPVFSQTETLAVDGVVENKGVDYRRYSLE